MSTRPAQRPAGAPPAGPLTAGSLCSGYGGLDLAVMAVTGARLAWVAETDRYAAGVLAHHWPGVRNLGDVTALDWAAVPPVDLVAAGWPCQDISYAGPGPASRKGPAVDCGCTSPTAFATFDPVTSTWRTSPRSARAASRKSSATWPRSGMTRNGRAFALPTPEPRTAATASSSLPSGPARPGGSRLLPTPDTGCSPNGHGRRGGRPGNGHQSGHGLDVAATALTPAPAPPACRSTVAWGEYEPAIRRWEHVLAHPAPPPAEPGPSGRPGCRPRSPSG